jgi:hypothetical protein
MSSRRSPIGELTTLATADDLDGTAAGNQELDLTGAAGAIIIQKNSGTAGTLGIDVIGFSRDGGSTWALATAANIGGGHAGLLLEDGSAAAAAGAALNAAGVEPSGDAIFSLGPVDGPFIIKCFRDATGALGTETDWATGAPAVVALRIG